MDEIWLETSTAVGLADFARDQGLELTRFAYLITGDRNQAEDVVQDVLLAMYRRFGPVVEIERPMAYARRAIVNAHLSWRRRRPEREVLSESTPDVVAVEAADQRSGAGALWSLVIELPHRQRAVLVLRYRLGCPDHEIAELLGCRESSVRSLATRALARLRPVVRAGNLEEMMW